MKKSSIADDIMKKRINNLKKPPEEKLLPPYFKIDIEKKKEYFDNLLKLSTPAASANITTSTLLPEVQINTEKVGSNALKKSPIKGNKSKERKERKALESEETDSNQKEVQEWLEKLKNHKIDKSLYRNHTRIQMKQRKEWSSVTSPSPAVTSQLSEEEEEVVEKKGDDVKKRLGVEVTEYQYTLSQGGGDRSEKKSVPRIVLEKKTKEEDITVASLPDELRPRTLINDGGTLKWVGIRKRARHLTRRPNQTLVRNSLNKSCVEEVGKKGEGTTKSAIKTIGSSKKKPSREMVEKVTKQTEQHGKVKIATQKQSLSSNTGVMKTTTVEKEQKKKRSVVPKAGSSLKSSKQVNSAKKPLTEVKKKPKLIKKKQTQTLVTSQ